MKKNMTVLVILLLAGFAFAQVEVKPYGFIKGDMYYATAGVQSWGTNAVSCAQVATSSDTAAIGFSAQHSRFGLKINGTNGETPIGGVLELDFFSVRNDANARPRIRLGYAWFKPLAGLEIRFGQQWDIIAPLNPSTNNTNANLWYNGNYGFRRGQIQARYSMDMGAVKPNAQFSIGEAAKEDMFAGGPGVGADNQSVIPMIQGRIGFGFMEKMEAGVSGMYAGFGENQIVEASGFAIDANLPINAMLALQGEFLMGTNINNANLFMLGGSGTAAADVENMGFWVNCVLKPMALLNVVLGYAQEDITSTVAVGGIESNKTVYGTLIVPMGNFSVSAEYQHFMTKYNGSDESSGVIDIAGKITF